MRLAPRVAALGAIGAVVAEDLANLQERISTCFEEEVQARFGPVPVSRSLRPQTDDHEGPTLLALQLETRPGAVRVVDAPLVAQGAASDGLVACVQQVLRGHDIPVDGVTATGRARLLFPVVP